jgi:hypothetical protein
VELAGDHELDSVGDRRRMIADAFEVAADERNRLMWTSSVLVSPT